MTHFDVNLHSIYRCYSGSVAYGMALSTSDVDVKGIAIAPREHVVGFAYSFEQRERSVAKGHAFDEVIYDLRKFMKLAAECNPNIVEMLFCHPTDILFSAVEALTLYESRELFLSQRAKHTFGGYAMSQLKRIRSHRRWLLDPPKAKPTREAFGLDPHKKLSADTMGAADAVIAEGHVLAEEAMQLLAREKSYGVALREWNQYESWKASRNEKRAALERDHGYDTKHAMHLVRLLRMCKEILSGEGVKVRRPDAEELLGIRRGQWPYEQLTEWAENTLDECEALSKTSALPHSPDIAKLNALCVELHESFWRRTGS